MLECAHCRIRDKTRRLKNETQGKDVRGWAVSAFLDAQKTMRTLKGHKDLWMLRAQLDAETTESEGVERKLRKAVQTTSNYFRDNPWP